MISQNFLFLTGIITAQTLTPGPISACALLLIATLKYMIKQNALLSKEVLCCAIWDADIGSLFVQKGQ